MPGTDAPLVRALVEGVHGRSPGALGDGLQVVLAAGARGRFGALVAVRHDPVDGLRQDAWFFAQDDGRWRTPGRSGSAPSPPWVLRRPDRGTEHREWAGSELAPLAGQWGFVDGVCVTMLGVMASRLVSTVTITYAEREVRRAVPPNGVVVVPVVLESANRLAVCYGYDERGRAIDRLRFVPAPHDGPTRDG